MRYLLDTHIFLWWLNGDRRLKPLVREIIQDKNNKIFVSVASGLEISIKRRTAKLKLKTTLKRSFEISGFEILNITLAHALQLEKLYTHHKDPFDRILISQSRVEKMILVTADKKMQQYNAKFLKLKN